MRVPERSSSPVCQSDAMQSGPGNWPVSRYTESLHGSFAALLWCFFDFVVKGLGTPNPRNPPKQLVVSGLYRYSRNPMYVAVLTVLCGEALWFERPILFGWAAVMFVVFTLFATLYEEPKLRTLFGDEYDRYRESVRRWL